MPPEINAWLQLLFRWLHVIAGVMWIGHLWFFNFVNAQVVKTYDADSKKKVVPELMPRALYWFRWGAAYTFITGILLLAMVYYMGGALVPPDGRVSVGIGSAISLGALVVGFVIYDMMWKALAKQEMAGMAISFVLTVGVAFGLMQIYSGRAVLIHIGGLFGTIMAANVWMRIWPNQKKIIAATKAGTAPDPAWAAMAGIYVPLSIAGFVAAGWLIAKLCFLKAATKAPAQFGAATAAAPPPSAVSADKK